MKFYEDLFMRRWEHKNVNKVLAGGISKKKLAGFSTYRKLEGLAQNQCPHLDSKFHCRPVSQCVLICPNQSQCIPICSICLNLCHCCPFYHNVSQSDPVCPKVSKLSQNIPVCINTSLCVSMCPNLVQSVLNCTKVSLSNLYQVGILGQKERVSNRLGKHWIFLEQIGRLLETLWQFGPILGQTVIDMKDRVGDFKPAYDTLGHSGLGDFETVQHTLAHNGTLGDILRQKGTLNYTFQLSAFC